MEATISKFEFRFDADTGRTLVGRCSHGHSYWLDADGYVYQLLASGHWNGWLCRATIWETFRRNMVTSIPAE